MFIMLTLYVHVLINIIIYDDLFLSSTDSGVPDIAGIPDFFQFPYS